MKGGCEVEEVVGVKVAGVEEVVGVKQEVAVKGEVWWVRCLLVLR